MDNRIEIVEGSPRDGLQNEREVVSTAAKVRLVEDLVAAGVRRMEVTSFVHPERVPQMADAEQVMAAVPRRDDLSCIGLVLNLRGAVRATAAGVDEINYVVPATDTFGQRNQGVTTRQALDALGPIGTVAREHGARLSVTVAVGFGCPYEGEVSTARLSEVAGEVVAAGVDELALADTLGSAVPREVTERVRAVQHLATPLRLHLHETRHTGLANALAAIEAGVTVLDASAAGLGGCPFAPGAAGNVATEDLAWMLARSGYDTGLDVPGVVAAGRRVCASIGLEPRSGVARAVASPEAAIPVH
ncbi:hydroxymethylglutaryl-CoA lyase [Modestobacter sp. I12A-02662]|uniref:hydroxymethylglutaryl-CoA lyase n=1 Tax=Modestobacter sp. I12A-02662 TaxID=1730496 RepID=UPI0034DFFA2C